MWNPWQGSITDVSLGTGRPDEILDLTTLDGEQGQLLVSVGPGWPIRLWPLRRYREPSELPDRDGGTRCVVETCPAGDGSVAVAVGTTSGPLRLLNLDGTSGYRSTKRLTGHAGRITGLATIAGSGGRGARLGQRRPLAPALEPAALACGQGRLVRAPRVRRRGGSKPG